MEKTLLALKLFGANNSVESGGKAVVDYGELAIGILLKFIDVLEGVAIIIAGIFAVRLIKRYFSKIETTHERQRTALNLLEKITNGFTLVIATTLGLKVMGLDLTLIISVLTLGLSFGLRDVIKNYIAGILILFKSPFEIGDTVKIRSFTGKITKIEFQSITITTFDNKEVTIHNKDMLTQPITNYSKGEQRRLEINFKLGYGSDLARTLKIVSRVLDNNQNVLKIPRYTILFKSFENVGTELMARFWVLKSCNFLKIKTDIALQIQEALDEENLFAPYNREAGLAQDFGLTPGRKERLSVFYNQPIFVDLAQKTFEKIGVVISGNGAPVTETAPVQVYADADEPE